MQHDWREHYAFMRRLVRLRINRRPWMRSPSSVTEAMASQRTWSWRWPPRT